MLHYKYQNLKCFLIEICVDGGHVDESDNQNTLK